jgi:hypothetical protein
LCEENLVFLDLLDTRVGQNIDSIFCETSLGVFGESLIVGVENVASALDDVNGDFVSQDAWVVVAEIFVEHVVQFGGKFDTGWTTSADDKGEQATSLFIGRGWEGSGFEVADDFVADQACIGNVFEEVAVFETFDTVRVSHGADTDDELVVREVEVLFRAIGIGCLDFDELVGEATI